MIREALDYPSIDNKQQAHQNSKVIDWGGRRRALQGRHSCIAQGASPGE